jgi:hypothetical protein
MQWTAYGPPLPPGLGPWVSAVSPAELQRAHTKEESTWRWARLALVALLILMAGQWVGAFWLSHTFRQFWNGVQFQNGTVQQWRVTGYSPADGLYLDLFYLGAAAVGIVFMIWQHSAATVARALGYPARTSPGFGVGSWFIPVINLWFPYWALSDTLPPDHPLRSRCLWAWLSYLGAVMTGGVTAFVALASTAAAVAFMFVSGMLAVTAIGLGAQLITAVHDDHRHRLASASP